jgi:hypothetical protein
MSKNNDLLNVGVKKGTFYLSSNDNHGEGWERQEFKNPQTGADMVKYHKNVTIKGDVVYVAMREDKHKGMCLNMIVSGDDVGYSLQIPIINANGSVKATNEYFNSLVGALENIEFGDTVTMFVNNKNKDKKDRLYRNIVVLDEEGKLIKSNFDFKDIPKWESTKTTDDFGAEKTVWNPSPTNKFYIAKFTEISNKWEKERTERKAKKANNDSASNNSGSQEGAQANASKPAGKPSAPADDYPVDDYDDLPF